MVDKMTIWEGTPCEVEEVTTLPKMKLVRGQCHRPDHDVEMSQPEVLGFIIVLNHTSLLALEIDSCGTVMFDFFLKICSYFSTVGFGRILTLQNGVLALHDHAFGRRPCLILKLARWN